ncbi:MAG: DUF4097 family beta strand repeat-containing protein [Acidobacteriota bacterium]
MFFRSRKLTIVSAIAAITMAAAGAVFAQSTSAPMPLPPTVERGRVPRVAPPVRIWNEDHERAIKTDANINLSLCVLQGDVKVNGWNRNEVRILVTNGRNFTFKVQQKSARSGDPVWIMAVAEAANKEQAGPISECLRGDEIEIDAPVNATFNLKGQEVNTVVDGIRRVSVKNAGGDISVRNISDGVTAATYRGDLTVEQSKGAMVLENTAGNILVFDAGPSEIGDIFKAKTTSGAISVQKIGHRQIEVNSISGTVAYNGDILSGGSYSFWTSNGSIKLSLPANSSGMLTASYGYGSFNSELPFKLNTETVTPGPVKSIIATMGSGGDATLKLTTNNGSISIKKQ